MTNLELRKRALAREEERSERLAAAVDGLPTNKGGRFKSAEANMLLTQIKQADKALCYYDARPEPPAVAGITETWFDAAIERLTEIKNDQHNAAEPSDD